MIIFKLMIVIIFIIYYYYYININEISCILIAIFSCNRFIYLNRTLEAFYNHLLYYEYTLKYNVLFLDQGTYERYNIVKIYNIYNAVFMNPKGYQLSFNIVFSYLYTKYILLLEEDWEVYHNIEKKILYPSFIQESIQILNNENVVYGIVLREVADILVGFSILITTKMGKHILYIFNPPKNRYSYTNGASIYRTAALRKLKIYKDEYSTSRFFRNNNYKMGFTYKGISCMKNSSKCQSVMKHIGINTTRKGICNLWLY